MWVASYPPLFAFVVFKNKSDANEALAALNNTFVSNYFYNFFKLREMVGSSSGVS